MSGTACSRATVPAINPIWYTLRLNPSPLCREASISFWVTNKPKISIQLKEYSLKQRTYYLFLHTIQLNGRKYRISDIIKYFAHQTVTLTLLCMSTYQNHSCATCIVTTRNLNRRSQGMDVKSCPVVTVNTATELLHVHTPPAVKTLISTHVKRLSRQLREIQF
jgi:hypothetical protein